jgi:NADH:ubiquinone oxidoreductase subunit F (NADH-binding)/(2Fe-2S) ferredoxin/NAD-dependent dihydropyrimidine dehydrogenase PreA subunit
MQKLKSPHEVKELRLCLEASETARPTISVCASATCGMASGAEEVYAAFQKELRRVDAVGIIDLKSTGCHGLCEKEPTVMIWPDRVFYNKVGPSDAKNIVASLMNGHKPVEKLLYKGPDGERIVHEHEIAFYARQQRNLFGNNSRIDPKQIRDYIRIGGYSALARVLSEFSPEQVVEEVKKSGLRGRGGAGFPTTVKWEALRASKNRPRYIVCNADEGDPGAFMDRSLLEGNPHSVIEGMIIGAYALEASAAYIYVRAEYPLAVEHLNIAIQQAEHCGLLGEKILGLPFDFRIHLVMGAGAFVCGEETALIASLEGKVGEPHPRPPYPVQKGLWGKPTVINNVKTWANVPVIINKGSAWYSKIGTERSKGTAAFSLVGKIHNTGLVEVPMGITLREMIYTIGGGIPKGKQLKAIQIGGPSGGCIPASLIDLPIDYEALTQAGSMMGSGGMVVMDEDTCMVDIARYFMEFLEEESCGKCFPCREGTQRLKEILNRIATGKGTEEDLELLDDAGWMIKETSLCGLGQTAPNPVLSTLRYFRDEYLAHIREKRCPAKVCKELIVYEIDETICDGCHACVRVCASEAILGEKDKPHEIESAKCLKCGACLEVCQPKAVLVH